jgi:membrane protease YdiL (CAAX protease family)
VGDTADIASRETGAVRALLDWRVNLGFALGGVAVVLRLASDWLFSQGGPSPYQLAQAALLALGLAVIWPRRDLVFLAGGDSRASLRRGLWAVPLGLVAGLGGAWLRFGAVTWPALGQLPLPLANNLFFCAVEELEFRGFFLGWALRRGLRPSWAIGIVAVTHTLAHAHRFWNGDGVAIVSTLAVTLWWTWLVARTRSIWGAYLAHLVWNVLLLLPELGSGVMIR